MGKRILVQRRGRGTPTFRAKTHRRVAPVKYPPPHEDTIMGVVKDILHDPSRGAPIALIELETGERVYNVAVEGLHVGQTVYMGAAAPTAIGNIIPIGRIPEGTAVCNIERRPGDGGKLVRASGGYATVVAHIDRGTIIRLPSGKTACLNDNCRATIGVVAGGGRIEKPFLKAGKKYHWMRAKGRAYPRVRGVAMNACSHPHGGGRWRHMGRPKTVSRHAPPGRKVGLIAARRTGRRKRK